MKGKRVRRSGGSLTSDRGGWSLQAVPWPLTFPGSQLGSSLRLPYGGHVDLGLDGLDPLAGLAPDSSPAALCSSEFDLRVWIVFKGSKVKAAERERERDVNDATDQYFIQNCFSIVQ